jgi:DNA-binding response OmpR family regulator
MPQLKMQKTILVVDDQEPVRSAITDFLKIADYEVETASNGQEGLDVLIGKKSSLNPISLIITDLKMPVMDGMNMVEEAGRRGIKIPIVVITGSYDRIVSERLLQNGVVEILHKPFLPDELLLIVRGILRSYTLPRYGLR